MENTGAIRFSLEADKAAAMAREAFSKMTGGRERQRGRVKQIVEQFNNHKDDIIVKWMSSVKGTVNGPTALGVESQGLTNYGKLFDALVENMESDADPPLDSQLLDFCASVISLSTTEEVLRNTKEAVSLLTEASDLVLEGDHHESSGSSGYRPDSLLRDPSLSYGVSGAGFALQHLNTSLHKTHDHLTQAFARTRRTSALETQLMVVGGRESLLEANQTLWLAIDKAKALLPSCTRMEGDPEAILKKATEAAQAIQAMAQRVEMLSPYSKSVDMAKVDEMLLERQVLDLRIALVSFLRSRHSIVSQKWLAKIAEKVPAYRSGATKGASTEINQVMINAMIAKLAPNGDSASLVYIVQELVERRRQTHTPESVQHATQLFEDAVMDMFTELCAESNVASEFLPLVHGDRSLVRSMVADVVFLANRLILSEYHMWAARQSDPRLPGSILQKAAGMHMDTAELRARIPELIIGAVVAEQYRIEAHIMAGGFGHGWRAADLHNNNAEVFLKSFKSKEEFAPGLDTVVTKMVEELEIADRVKNVSHLMSHPNVVSVLKVYRGAKIRLGNGYEDNCFHGIVTEYADGGELFNYLVIQKAGGGLTGCSFSERKARFLFNQIIELLIGLHYPGDNGEAYFHGDLKDQNLVVSGSTLKLIDYGTLTKVSDHVGKTVRHVTASHQQPFHTNCESVDLWSAGIILLDMLVIDTCGQCFKVSQGVNRGVADLRAEKFWTTIERRLMKFPDHCLLKTGPDTVRDLLSRIFVTGPRNSLSLKAIRDHPWMKGQVCQPQEMASEFQARFQGIRAGAPRGTVFFALSVNSLADGVYLMKQVIKTACNESAGKYHVGPESGDSLMVFRWKEGASGANAGAAGDFERMYDTDGQWVTSKYSVTVGQNYDITMGRNVTRLKLMWVSGKNLDDFNQFWPLVQKVLYQLGK